MTSPQNVGAVAVDVVADARNLAKKIRKDIEDGLRGLNVGKAIRDAVGTVRVPVVADLDASAVNGRFGAQRLPVTVDLDSAAFEARLKTLLRDRTVNVRATFSGGNLPNFGAVAGQAAQLGGALQNAAGQATGLVAGLSRVAGPVGTIVSLLGAAAGAALALGAAAAVLPSAFAAAAGAAAAIPAALAGVGAAVGTLALGFKGIGEAFKPQTGGGGGAAGQAANQARQVAAASRQVEAARRGIVAANRQLAASERGLAAAQRGVQAAQRSYADSLTQVAAAEDRARRATEAVSRARREAKEDIEDLGRSLRGAVISEAEATQAVNDALLALGEAKLTGVIPDIARAQNAYDRAVLSLEEARDTTRDLSAETADANRKGVEGSDRVQDALRDQADAFAGVQSAQQGVLDAQNGILDANDALAGAYDGLAAAQDGVKSAADGLASANDALAASQQKVAAGAGGVGKELTKLAPSAQRFVNAIKSLKPAFESLRLDVQERLFRNLDQTVLRLGAAWIPALRTTLGSYADTFNTFFRNLGASITTPKFISDIQAGAEGARQGLERIGSSITTSLVPAFGALSRAAGPFLAALGKEIAQIVTDFSNWVLQGERTGGLTRFFDRASRALHDIFTTGRLVTKIVGQLIGIIIGADQGSDKSALDTFNNGLQKISDWLADPANQQKIRDFVADVRNALFEFGRLAGQVSGFLDRIGLTGGAKGGSVGESIGKAIISGIIAGIGLALKEAFSKWDDYFSPAGMLVGPIKRLLGISSPSTVFMAIGRDLIAGLIAGIGQSFGQLRTRAAQIRANVLQAIGNAGVLLVQTGRNLVSGAMTGITNMLGSLRSRAVSIRTTVTGALGGAASWLVATGHNAIVGLWNGIASLGGWLYDRVASFVRNNVVGAVQRFLRISSPSRVMAELGGYTAIGLAEGMNGKAAAVQAAADRLAALAVPSLGTAGFGADLDASISRSVMLADQQTLQLAWKAGATYDPVLKGFQEVIDVVYRNDPVAAFSR